MPLFQSLGVRVRGISFVLKRETAQSVGEETLFRGVLLRRLSADTGRVAGVLLSTALYAVVHALRPGGAPDAYAWAGVERTLALLAPLGNPGALPSIMGL